MNTDNVIELHNRMATLASRLVMQRPREPDLNRQSEFRLMIPDFIASCIREKLYRDYVFGTAYLFNQTIAQGYSAFALIRYRMDWDEEIWLIHTVKALTADDMLWNKAATSNPELMDLKNPHELYTIDGARFYGKLSYQRKDLELYLESANFGWYSTDAVERLRPIIPGVNDQGNGVQNMAKPFDKFGQKLPPAPAPERIDEILLVKDRSLTSDPAVKNVLLAMHDGCIAAKLTLRQYLRALLPDINISQYDYGQLRGCYRWLRDGLKNHEANLTLKRRKPEIVKVKHKASSTTEISNFLYDFNQRARKAVIQREDVEVCIGNLTKDRIVLT